MIGVKCDSKQPTKSQIKYSKSPKMSESIILPKTLIAFKSIARIYKHTKKTTTNRYQ